MAGENTDSFPAEIYRHLFEHAADPIFVLDTGGNFIEVNRAACEQLGYSRGELLRMRPEHIEDDTSHAKISRHMAPLERDRNLIFEAVHVHRNGTRIPVEMHIRRIECGGTTYSLNICRNTANRMQRELEYQAMIQASTDGFWAVRASDARILEVNDAYCKMSGYTRNELLSMDISGLEAAETPEETRAHAWKIIEAGHDFFETVHRRKDGSLTEVEVKASYSSLGGGMFFVLVRDITARKRAQALLYDSEERFRKMFEKAPIGVGISSGNLKIFLANPAMCALFGYTPEELRHLTVFDLTHPDYLGETRQNVRTLLDGALSSYTVEKKFLKKGGDTFWGRATATEVLSRGSERRYIMALIEDITGRVEREERRLAEMREQKDILVRELHHRIKNNLQGVVGLLGQYAARHPEMSEVLGAAAGKIHSIAAIHGLQARALSEAVNLATLMEQIIGAQECTIRLVNELSGPVALCKEEAVPIALILNELVTNACKHSRAACRHPGCIPITASLSGGPSCVTVVIANPFDDSAGDENRRDSGLQLAGALLPKESARFEIRRRNGIFSATLELRPPII
jgi:PAS domain S-box-containing protein